MRQEAVEAAWRVLDNNSGELGLRAAGSAYPEVWARDAIVSGLGMAASGTADQIDPLWRSLESLAGAQSALGRIPNHVRLLDNGTIEADTVFAGAIDASLWYIIAHEVLASATTDTQHVAARWESLERAYVWLQYQDSNECGLLEVHESMDWADLFSNRYNSLLPNILWYGANQAMHRMATSIGKDHRVYAARALDIHFRINQLLWVGPEVTRDSAWIASYRKEWEYPTQHVDTMLVTQPYYLPYMAFRDFGDRCDTLGNLLAIIFGVADQRQAGRILDYIEETGMAEPWPIKACWPPIRPGERDWREYYRQYNLNIPDQYHNGGAWPYLGGFFVAALVRAGRFVQATLVRDRLIEMNRTGRRDADWEFNEWFHGISGRPMGHAYQSWSAGMLLYADSAVRLGRCPHFQSLT